MTEHDTSTEASTIPNASVQSQDVMNQVIGGITLKQYAQMLAFQAHFKSEPNEKVLEQLGFEDAITPQMAWAITLGGAAQREDEETLGYFARVYKQTEDYLKEQDPALDQVNPLVSLDEDKAEEEPLPPDQLTIFGVDFSTQPEGEKVKPLTLHQLAVIECQTELDPNSAEEVYAAHDLKDREEREATLAAWKQRLAERPAEQKELEKCKTSIFRFLRRNDPDSPWNMERREDLGVLLREEPAPSAGPAAVPAGGVAPPAPAGMAEMPSRSAASAPSWASMTSSAQPAAPAAPSPPPSASAPAFASPTPYFTDPTAQPAAHPASSTPDVAGSGAASPTPYFTAAAGAQGDAASPTPYTQSPAGSQPDAVPASTATTASPSALRAEQRLHAGHARLFAHRPPLQAADCLQVQNYAMMTVEVELRVEPEEQIYARYGLSDLVQREAIFTEWRTRLRDPRAVEELRWYRSAILLKLRGVIK